MTTLRRAAGYARISSDAEGLALGVGRQQEDVRRKAANLGVELVPRFYVDNDRGASTRSKKPRPDYIAMMDAAKRGEFDIIISYSNSRLTRRPLELEDIIKLHEATGITIETCVSGSDDLSTADGRMVARIKASVDAAEAERVAERVARVHHANAMLGRPVGGTRPFGWEADKLTLFPEESDVLLEAAMDVIEGKSLNGVAASINERGFTTTKGLDWQGKTLRQTLMNPRLAGWRTVKKQIAVHDVTGVDVCGLWEPLMDQEVFDRLQLVLRRPEGRTRIPRRSARHYLLTGLVKCGICNGVMYGSKRGGGLYYYTCNSKMRTDHSMSASGKEIDKLVSAQVLLKMNAFEAPVPEVAFDGQARMDEIDVMIREAMAELRAGKVSSRVVFAHVGELEAEREHLDAQRVQWLRAAIGPATKKVTPKEWQDMDTDEKRAHIEKFLTAVVTHPASRKARTFDATRLSYVWREDD